MISKLALRPLAEGEEITVDYNAAVGCRSSPPSLFLYPRLLYNSLKPGLSSLQVRYAAGFRDAGVSALVQGARSSEATLRLWKSFGKGSLEKEDGTDAKNSRKTLRS